MVESSSLPSGKASMNSNFVKCLLVVGAPPFLTWRPRLCDRGPRGLSVPGRRLRSMGERLRGMLGLSVGVSRGGHCSPPPAPARQFCTGSRGV